ncbi:MAG TPA: 6-carboxytetrahydropterin synthase [Gemmatirosa sp.]|nr:6-carboxytetrahydropterin synthase [Gemmatirosa sp.]
MPPHASLTRRVTFAAAHRYRRPEWSDERNAQVFGACARPSFHGHSYVCHVTVRGPVDRETGFCVDLALLDRVLHEEVRERFDHRNLNVDVPEFADGLLVPTGENLALHVCARVQGRLDTALGAGAPRVTRVQVAEDETLSVTYEPERDA